MNKKIIILSILFILLSTGCACSKKKDIVQKIDDIVVETKEISELEFKNTSLTIVNGLSKLTTTITNKAEKEYKIDEYIIICKDEKDNIIAEINGYVGDVLGSLETRIIESNIDVDLSKVRRIEYKEKRELSN